MNVRDIITLAANLSIGLDEPSDSDIPVFLRYLNLAYFELLRVTALTNPLLPKKCETLDCTDGVVNSTQDSIFNVRAIYIPDTGNPPLKGTNLDALLKIDPELKTKATNYPYYWYFDSGHLNVYPLYTGDVGVLYIPNPPQLKIDTVEDAIYIPDLYQSILIDGLVYWGFQAEGGFKNSQNVQEAKVRWKENKTGLASYMLSLSGQSFYSTFSPV